MDEGLVGLSQSEIEELAAVLGEAGRVTYAPPNIYPMSAPTFVTSSRKERQHPSDRQLGLYVHIPFCNYSCSFCFYATRLTPPPEQMRRYLVALRRELAWVEPGTRLTQLYVGGGTPTTLPPELLDELLTDVFRRFDNGGNKLHTVETSPESLTPAHVAVLQRHSIGRVSMGIQSLSDDVLDTVKRRHGPEQALAACDLLVHAGLMVNVDLIFGLPGQTEESFCRDLTTLAGHGIHSVTTYNLRVNERTPVGREVSEAERLDLEALARWRARIRQTAAELGFEPVRWHTFRRQGPHATAADVASRYEDITGQGNQFGIGVSARSRLDGVVFRNHSSYDGYLGRIEAGESPVEEAKELNETERKLRFVALSLGDGKPLVHEHYERELGGTFEDDFGEAAGKLRGAGLIADEAGRTVMTAKGQLVFDLVMRAFYPNPVRRWLDDRQQLADTAANLRGRSRTPALS